MRIRSLICPIVAITIVGCSSTEPPEATPMADAVEDETTVENSETDEVEASFDIGEWVESDRSELESIDACRIADITGVRGEAPTAPDQYYASLGFPRSTLLPDTLGALKLLVVPFGYADRPIAEGRTEQIERSIRSMNLYIEAFSYGKASIEAQVVPEGDGVELDVTESTLSGRGMMFNQIDLATTLVESIAPEYLNTDFDVLLLLGPTDSTVDTAQAMDPRLTTGDGRPIQMPAGVDRIAILSGRNAGYTTVVVHELMHSWLGLEDLYPFSGGDSYTDRWSIMSQAVLHRGAELLGYERFLAGWLDDESVRCAPNNATTSHILFPVTDQDNPGLVLIPESDHSVIAVETRGKTVFNTEIATPVFRVDTSEPSGNGPIRLLGYLDDIGDVVAAGRVDIRLDDGTPGQPSLITVAPREAGDEPGDVGTDPENADESTEAVEAQERCSRPGDTATSTTGAVTCRPTADGNRWILEADGTTGDTTETLGDVAPCRLESPDSGQFSTSVDGELTVALIAVSFPSYAFDHDPVAIEQQWAEVGEWLVNQSDGQMSLRAEITMSAESQLDPDDIAASYDQVNEVRTFVKQFVREVMPSTDEADVVVLVLPKSFTSRTAQGPSAWWEVLVDLDGTPVLMPGHVLTYAENQQSEPWAPLAALFMGAIGPDARIAGSHSLETSVAGGYNILAGWPQWLLGWITDDQVACVDLDSDPVTVSLTPLQSDSDGTRLAAVPVSATEVLVIESHRDDGWSSAISNDTRHEGAYGLRVYVIDAANRADLNWGPQGGAEVGNRMLLSDELLAAAREPIGPDPFSPLVLQGEQVRYGDVVVKYIEAGTRDTIRISR